MQQGIHKIFGDLVDGIRRLTQPLGHFQLVILDHHIHVIVQGIVGSGFPDQIPKLGEVGGHGLVFDGFDVFVLNLRERSAREDQRHPWPGVQWRRHDRHLECRLSIPMHRLWAALQPDDGGLEPIPQQRGDAPNLHQVEAPVSQVQPHASPVKFVRMRLQVVGDSRTGLVPRQGGVDDERPHLSPRLKMDGGSILYNVGANEQLGLGLHQISAGDFLREKGILREGGVSARKKRKGIRGTPFRWGVGGCVCAPLRAHSAGVVWGLLLPQWNPVDLLRQDFWNRKIQ